LRRPAALQRSYSGLILEFGIEFSKSCTQVTQQSQHNKGVVLSDEQCEACEGTEGDSIRNKQGISLGALGIEALQAQPAGYHHL
jgi:hypothetical protein